MAPPQKQGNRKSAKPVRGTSLAPGDEIDRRTPKALERAIGVVLKNGQFECRCLVGKESCGSRIKNAKSNLRSHYTKSHRTRSSYQDNQKGGEKWPCVDGCKNAVYKNFNTLVGHARNKHGMRGSSAGLKIASIKKRKELSAEVNDNNDDQGEEEREEEGEEEGGDDYTPPNRPNRDHDHGNQDQDPPNSNLPIPVA
ncbi:hypothetical protein F4804DRAFT_336330 [Jackrogersella minutella]|nr:hypothetical protein F4804DRAFT_336330 [Jackrogersella minutella]